MSDEIVNEIETPEIEQEVIETPESESKVVEVEKPWKKEKEKEVSENIPYNRFKEVLEDKKMYKEKVEQYEKELAELREKVTPKKKEIEDPDELDPNDFETVKDYLKARDRVQEEKIQKAFMERMENTRIQKANEEYQAKIVSDFQKNVEEAMKYNPEVVDAIQYIERYAEKINPNVRRALLTDDNAADLCYEIATNKDLLKLVIDGDPIDAVRAMTKWSAKFTRDSDKIVEKKSDEVPTDVKAMIPKTVKGTISQGKKDPNKMSMSEYRKWRYGN